MSLRPTSELVAIRWLEVAVPGPRVGDVLPEADPELRTDGFLRIAVVGGTPDVYMGLRAPVFAVECWVAPAADGSSRARWRRAGQLAQQVYDAAYDPNLMNKVLDLSQFGDYQPAHVFTVVPVTEPTRIEGDPNEFARVDLNLHLTWAPTS